MRFRGCSAVYALSISLVFTACGELPGFQVGQKSDYGVQSIKPVDFTDLDILFVVDNSGSMAQEQANLVSSFGSFISQFDERDLNFHLGVISTETTPAGSVWKAQTGGCYVAPYVGINNDGPFTLLSKYPSYKFLTPAVPGYVEKFKDNVKLGICGSGYETGILSAHNFLDASRIGPGGYNEDFIRPDGFLAVIFLSDEDEGVSATDARYIKGFADLRKARVNDFAARLKSIKPGHPELLRVDAIVAPVAGSCAGGNADGEVYAEVAAMFNGMRSDICKDFSSQLVSIGTQILTFLTRFPLLQPPVGADVEVRVNGSIVLNDATNGWMLIEDKGKFFVEFRGTGIPNNGDQIQITYVPSRPVG